MLIEKKTIKEKPPDKENKEEPDVKDKVLERKEKDTGRSRHIIACMMLYWKVHDETFL